MPTTPRNPCRAGQRDCRPVQIRARHRCLLGPGCGAGGFPDWRGPSKPRDRLWGKSPAKGLRPAGTCREGGQQSHGTGRGSSCQRSDTPRDAGDLNRRTGTGHPRPHADPLGADVRAGFGRHPEQHRVATLAGQVAQAIPGLRLHLHDRHLPGTAVPAHGKLSGHWGESLHGSGELAVLVIHSAFREIRRKEVEPLMHNRVIRDLSGTLAWAGIRATPRASPPRYLDGEALSVETGGRLAGHQNPARTSQFIPLGRRNQQSTRTRRASSLDIDPAFIHSV